MHLKYKQYYSREQKHSSYLKHVINYFSFYCIRCYDVLHHFALFSFLFSINIVCPCNLIKSCDLLLSTLLFVFLVIYNHRYGSIFIIIFDNLKHIHFPFNNSAFLNLTNTVQILCQTNMTYGYYYWVCYSHYFSMV